MYKDFFVGTAIQIAIIITILITSCSRNDTDSYENKYLEIPDSSFEAILIEHGIDSEKRCFGSKCSGFKFFK